MGQLIWRAMAVPSVTSACHCAAKQLSQKGKESWDGWVGVVKAFAAVAVPSCIRQWPKQLLQAVNGLIEVENLD